LCISSPTIPIPVPPPVENPPSTASEDITPGLCTMSLLTMAALSVLQESAAGNEPTHQLWRSQRRCSSGSTCQAYIAHASAPSPSNCSTCIHNYFTSPKPSTISHITIITTNPNNNFVCHNCQDPSHHHKYCPKYHCHVCCVYAPGHFSVFCKKLNGKAVLPINWKDPKFYSALSCWEADRDAADLCVTEEQDALLHQDTDYDHTLYDNVDC